MIDQSPLHTFISHLFFFFNDTPTTEISPLPLHDALPILKVGQTGELSPGGRGEPQAYRRYRLPPEALNWGGENVLAVRVLGSGGIWSVRRSRPPREIGRAHV